MHAKHQCESGVATGGERSVLSVLLTLMLLTITITMHSLKGRDVPQSGISGTQWMVVNITRRQSIALPSIQQQNPLLLPSAVWVLL